MKGIQKYTFPISKSSTLRIGVVVHTSQAKLNARHRKITGGEVGEVEAFCHYEHVPSTDKIAELHFYRQHITPQLIAHEAFHATLVLARHWHADLENGDMEEMLAETIENIILSTLNLIWMPAKKDKL